MPAPYSEKPASGRTAFLVVQQGFGARYLLRTDIFRVLKASGMRLVILSPNADEDYFRKEFEGENVHVELFRSKKCEAYLKGSKGQKLFRLIRSFVLSGKGDLKTVEDHYRVFRQESQGRGPASRARVALIGLLVKFLRASLPLRRAFLAIENRLFRPQIHHDLFEKYRPSLVVTSSLGNVGDGFDFFIMREARDHGARVATVILSWDNTSSKGMGGAIPDSLIVWTEIMRRELIDYHDIPADKIFVGGIAHFDVYRRPEMHLSKEDLFGRFGLDPSRKLILFGTKSPVSYPWNADIVELIGEAIKAGEIRQPAQLLVRLHPIHFGFKNGVRRHEAALAEYDRLKGKYPHVHFNTPHILSEVLSFDMPAEEMAELASILHHTDVMVNMFSTLTLEASLMDVPTINICFEGRADKKKRARQSIQMDLDQVHNQRVIRTGGVKMAYQPNELIRYINGYLSRRDEDREGRSRVVRDECGPYGGNAGRAIAEHLLSLIRRTGDYS